MNNTFEIQFSPRESSARDPLDRVAEADIGIFVSDLCLTELEDRFAKTVRTTFRASTYRLAMWLAANWWRLRCEPESNALDWQLSHNLAAVGSGYVWPTLSLFTDGAFVTLKMRPSRVSPTEDIRYLLRQDLQIPVQSFISGIDRFIAAVIERLRATGHPQTELEKLWGEIQGERHDPPTAQWRKLEALAGLDPDSEEGAFLEPLLTQMDSVGQSGLEELIVEYKGATQEALGLLADLRARSAYQLAMPDMEPLRQRIQADAKQQIVHSTQIDHSDPPWQQAYLAAAAAREYWGFKPGPINNRQLADAVGAKDEALFTAARHEKAQLSAGFRADGPQQFTVALGAHVPTGRRFALARLLGDYLATPDTEHMLPATTSKTSRQKFQRAFAQQLLCPVDDLKAYLCTDEPSDEQIEDAAAEFEVSPLLIRATLVNHGLLDRQALQIL
jgi:hypothetical protein